MCNPAVKKAVNIAAAVIAPVALLANVGSYGAGKGAVQGAKDGGTAGLFKGALQGGQAGFTDPYGTISGSPTPNGSTDAPPPPTPTVPEPAPTFAPPTPSETAAMLRRKRLNNLRMGMASTIRTSGQGAGDTATLLSPVATGTAATGKTKLGQ